MKHRKVLRMKSPVTIELQMDTHCSAWTCTLVHVSEL